MHALHSVFFCWFSSPVTSLYTVLCSDIHTLILLWLLLSRRRKHLKGPSFLVAACLEMDEDLGGIINYLWCLRPLTSFLKTVAYLLWVYRESCMRVASMLIWMNYISVLWEYNENKLLISVLIYRDGQMLIFAPSNVSTGIC